MDGVTILNQTEIIRTSLSYIIITILLTFIIMAAAALCYGFAETYDYGPAILFGVVAAFLLVLFIYVQFKDHTINTGRYEYEAIISEDVSFTELYEKYEVVEQRGEIWVLKDKEEE